MKAEIKSTLKFMFIGTLVLMFFALVTLVITFS